MMRPILRHVSAGIGMGRTGRARSAAPRSPAADAAGFSFSGCFRPGRCFAAAREFPPSPRGLRAGTRYAPSRSRLPAAGVSGANPSVFPARARVRSVAAAGTNVSFFSVVVSARRGAGCSSYSPPQSLRGPAVCGRIALPHPGPGSALAFCQTRKPSRGGRLCTRSPLQVPFPGLFRLFALYVARLLPFSLLNLRSGLNLRRLSRRRLLARSCQGSLQDRRSAAR